jgi:hypothetical protein
MRHLAWLSEGEYEIACLETERVSSSSAWDGRNGADP